MTLKIYGSLRAFLICDTCKKKSLRVTEYDHTNVMDWQTVRVEGKAIHTCPACIEKLKVIHRGA